MDEIAYWNYPDELVWDDRINPETYKKKLMNQKIAIKMFEEAELYCEKNHPDELIWAKGIGPETFKNLKAQQFLAEYCWVVYASGFKVSTVKSIFPNLKKAFKDFELETLARMKSIKEALSVFNNERKASCFLNGSKMIADEGFSVFKKRLKNEGIDMLELLPGIGPITKFHLAKNIGFVDEAKPDIWLVRAAEVCDSTVEELVAFLSEKYKLSRNTVDVILWRHCADKGVVL